MQKKFENQILDSMTLQEEAKILKSCQSSHKLKPNFFKGSYGYSNTQLCMLEHKVTDFLSKSGYLVNKVEITQKSLVYVISVEIFTRRLHNKNLRRKLYQSNLAKQGLEQKELEFFSNNLFTKHFTKGIPCQWEVKFLDSAPYFLKKESKAFTFIEGELSSFKNFPFFQDSLTILQILSTYPSANLLANFIAKESFELRRIKPVLDCVSTGLDQIIDFSESALKGALLEVKGRAGGTDRAQRTLFRKNATPKHKISNPLNFGFSEVYSSHGLSGVKIWLNYKKS